MSIGQNCQLRNVAFLTYSWSMTANFFCYCGWEIADKSPKMWLISVISRPHVQTPTIGIGFLGSVSVLLWDWNPGKSIFLYFLYLQRWCLTFSIYVCQQWHVKIHLGASPPLKALLRRWEPQGTERLGVELSPAFKCTCWLDCTPACVSCRQISLLFRSSSRELGCFFSASSLS